MIKIHAGIWSGVAALVILLCQSTLVFGYADYSTSGDYNPTNSLDPGWYTARDNAADSVSYSRPVGDMLTIGAGKSYVTTSGYANAGTLSMGVTGWANSMAGNMKFSDARMRAGVSNQFTVLSGTSGLSDGDTTSLTLLFKVDGVLQAEARSYPGFGWAHAEMSADLSVRDSSTNSRLASLDAYGMVEASEIYMPIWGYSHTSSWEESWGGASNLGTLPTHSNSGTEKNYNENFLYPVDLSFDTGVMNLTFEAIVGHTINVSADLSTYVNAEHEGEAFADFSRTFGFDVASMGNGVQLAWNIPVQTNLNPVPEPSTVLLLGGGLAGLAYWRKRKSD